MSQGSASIGPVIELGGEKTYRKQLESINSLQKSFQAQLEKLAAEYDNGDASLEVLAKKTDIYSGSLEGQNQKIALAQKALDTFSNRQQEAANALESANNAYQDAKKKLDEMTASGKASTKGLDAQKEAVLKAEKAVVKAQNAYAGAEKGVNQWKTTLMKSETEAIRTAKALEETCSKANALKNVKLQKFKEQMEKISQTASVMGERMKSVGGTMTKYVTAPLTTGFALLTKGTEESRGSLSKLENNARLAEVRVGILHDRMAFLNAVTGELDSNVEALSNLLQAGYTNDNIVQIVEQLSGAVLRFPDTLKIESLSDSLQETIATQKATGQFAELLDRLGVNTEKFAAGLEKAGDRGKGAQFVLDELAKTDLSKATKTFKENNAAMIEGKEAAYQLQLQFARLGAKLQPIVTKITNGVAKLLDEFNGLDEETQNIIIGVGLVGMAIGPLISAVGSLTSGIGLLAAAHVTNTASTVASTAATTANTTAMAASAVATTTATGATIAFNAALVATPAGLMAAGIAAVTAGIIALVYNMQKAIPEVDALNKKMKEEKETLSELKAERRENIDAGMAEINYTHRLWEELQSYVDESGRVIENKTRVKMITDEINKVLPGSVKWVDNERIAYEKGTEAINQMIAMKRAKIVLDAMEPEYREAILNIREKEVQQAELQYGIEQRLARIQQLQAEQAKSFSFPRMTEINTLKREVNQLSDAFEKNGRITDNHLITIKNYEYGMQAIASNSTRAMEKFVDAYGVGWSDIGKLTESGIEKQRIALEQARENYKKGLITKGTLEAIERQFDELVQRAQEAGVRVPQGIARGIKDGSGAAVSAMQNVVDEVTKTAKDGWKIKSPSRVFRDDVGRYLPQGIAEGFKIEMPRALRRMQAAMSHVAGSLQNRTTQDFVVNYPGASTGAAASGGSVFYVTIDAKNVREFNDIVEMAKNARQDGRKR